MSRPAPRADSRGAHWERAGPPRQRGPNREITTMQDHPARLVRSGIDCVGSRWIVNPQAGGRGRGSGKRGGPARCDRGSQSTRPSRSPMVPDQWGPSDPSPWAASCHTAPARRGGASRSQSLGPAETLSPAAVCRERDLRRNDNLATTSRRSIFPSRLTSDAAGRTQNPRPGGCDASLEVSVTVAESGLRR